jgi:hypothetical protein
MLTNIKASMRLQSPTQKCLLAIFFVSNALYSIAYGASCPNTGADVVVSTDCVTLSITSPKTSVTINSPAIVRNELAGNPPAANVTSTVTTFTNNGSILADQFGINTNGLAIVSGANVTTLNNSGTISSNAINTVSSYYSAIFTEGTVSTLNNTGTISTGGSGINYGVVVGGIGSIGQINNSGSIRGNANAILLSGSIGTLANTGTISGGNASSLSDPNGITVTSGGSLSVLTNSGSGSISSADSSGFGIYNQGTITTLNNQQNGLKYKGALPTNYNVIISSASSYGKLVVTSGTGNTNFGIATASAGAGVVSGTAYASVLSGVTNAQLGISGLSKTGTSNGYTYTLAETGAGTNLWDLTVSAYSSGGGGGGGDSGGGSVAPVTPDCTANASVSASCQNLALNSAGKISIAAGTTVSATGVAAVVNSGTTTSLTNNGTIAGNASGVSNTGTIQTLTNNGTISGAVGVNNTSGTIGTLQNAQGGTSGPLTYAGNLPSSYVVIVNGTSSYGQLSASTVSGVMGFSVAAGSVLAKGTYNNVLMGFNSSYLTNTMGAAGGYLYKLSQANATSTNWNLIAAASVADTNSSLVQTTNALQGQFGSQSNAVITGMTYDCNLFGPNNVCISAGGRATNNSAQGYNTASALLIAAYRASNQMRFGAYLDQNLSASNPNGIISAGNGQPMGGLFAVWNDKLDGTGTEIKASVAYNNKNMTITRPVVGTSEAGSGSTGLTSQGVNAIAKYGFGVSNQVVVSPYVGVRYMNTNMGSYSESASSSVLFPLSYASMSMNATTALAGLGANYKATEDWTFVGSAGVESDLSTSNGSYTVTNVSGLTPVGLNPNPVKTRPTAMLAAYYNLDKNTQLGLTGLYRTDSFSGMSSTTGMATVTFGI